MGRVRQRVPAQAGYRAPVVVYNLDFVLGCMTEVSHKFSAQLGAALKGKLPQRLLDLCVQADDSNLVDVYLTQQKKRIEVQVGGDLVMLPDWTWRPLPASIMDECAPDDPFEQG